MFLVDIKGKEGSWFQLAEGAEVFLQPLTSEQYKEIEKEVVTKLVEYVPDKSGKLQRIEYEEVDEDKRRELTWDKIIVNWKGITIDPSGGEELPCVKENKVLLMKKSLQFAQFVTNIS